MPKPAAAVVALWILVAPVSPVAASEAEDQYAIAAGHYSQRRWHMAAEAFQTFLERFPNHPLAAQASFFLGETLLQLDRPDAAAASFQDYLAQDPQGRYSRRAKFRAAEAAYLAGHHDHAKRQLEQFVNQYPKDPLTAYALTYLGEISLKQQQYQRAEAYFRETLAEFPRAAHQDRSRYGLAQALQEQGKHDEAERLFLAVAAKVNSPLADRALFRLGALQYTAGRFDDAVQSFQELQRRFPNSSWLLPARLGQAWALLKAHRLDEAAEIFRLLVDDPQLGAEAGYGLGLTYKAQGRWQAAASAFIETAGRWPHHDLAPAMRLEAGYVLLRSGEPIAATAQFDHVLASPAAAPSRRAEAIRGKLQAALAAGDHATVEREAEKFFEQFPESPLRPAVAQLLARSLIQRQQYDRAVHLLEPLAGKPANSDEALETHYLLALAYHQVQQLEDALAALRPVLDRPDSDLHPDALLLAATVLVSLGRYAEAVEPLEAYLAGEEKPPRAAEARGQLAVCYAHTGKLEAAERTYAELARQAVDDALLVPVAHQLAEAARRAGKAAWAQELYQWLAEHAGPDVQADALARLAWLQFHAGHLADAAASCQKLLRHHPTHPLVPESALLRGRILQRLNQYDEALAMYDLVVEQFPGTAQHADALLAAACLRDQLGDDKAAADLYQQWLKRYPHAPQADMVLYQWAWTLYDTGQPDEAMRLFQRLSGQYPQSRYWADATYRVAEYAYQSDDYDQAEAMVQAILEKATDQTIRRNARYLQGQIAAAHRQWQKAREAFETLLADHPHPPLELRAQYWVAETFFQQGDFQQARRLLEELARKTENSPEPWTALVPLRLAQTLASQKRWREAYEIASTIESRFPDFPQQYEADYIIGRYLATQADFEGARAKYREVYQSPSAGKTETAAEARFMTAESYFHQKRYQEALREYLAVEILYAYPAWQAAAVLQAGKCYERLGEWEQAAQQYRRLLQLYPDSQYTSEASKRLAIIEQRLTADQTK